MLPVGTILNVVVVDSLGSSGRLNFEGDLVTIPVYDFRIDNAVGVLRDTSLAQELVVVVPDLVDQRSSGLVGFLVITRNLIMILRKSDSDNGDGDLRVEGCSDDYFVTTFIVYDYKSRKKEQKKYEEIILCSSTKGFYL